MNTKELIERVANDSSGLKKPQVRRVLDALVSEIQQAAGGGDTVVIKGFGRFKMREPAAGTEGKPRLVFQAARGKSEAPTEPAGDESAA